jgi:creatinine amidohydrolase/Fe(II)-dependent formamide hydrolase-like protein
MPKRLLLATICVACCTSTISLAQVLSVSELSSRDLQELDRNRTVVMIPGGIFEQHGPYLPSFTDGYLNEWVARRTAEAIVAERDLIVLMFPTIPLGVGTPEDFGGLSPFSGSYTLRPETLRAVYMDLAGALGQDGFRTIFLVNRHGAPAHNQALLDAAEYFEDRFGGTMAALTSLIHEDGMRVPDHLDPEQVSENGVDVHAGEEESSQTLFLRPDLVHDDLINAAAFTAVSTDDLTKIAEGANWKGYFGSPRLATPKAGALIVDFRTKQTIDLALRILDGFDWRSLRTRADRTGMSASFKTVDDNNLRRAEEERAIQEVWLRKNR